MGAGVGTLERARRDLESLMPAERLQALQRGGLTENEAAQVVNGMGGILSTPISDTGSVLDAADALRAVGVDDAAQGRLGHLANQGLSTANPGSIESSIQVSQKDSPRNMTAPMVPNEFPTYGSNRTENDEIGATLDAVTPRNDPSGGAEMSLLTTSKSGPSETSSTNDGRPQTAKDAMLERRRRAQEAADSKYRASVLESPELRAAREGSREVRRMAKERGARGGGGAQGAGVHFAGRGGDAQDEENRGGGHGNGGMSGGGDYYREPCIRRDDCMMATAAVTAAVETMHRGSSSERLGDPRLWGDRSRVAGSPSADASRPGTAAMPGIGSRVGRFGEVREPEPNARRSSMVSPPVKVSQPITGGWRLSERKSLGSGSFGQVFLGLNTNTGELIAVKRLAVPNDQISDRSAEAMGSRGVVSSDGIRCEGEVHEDGVNFGEVQREVGLMATLAHANIVRYLGCELHRPKENDGVSSMANIYVLQEWVRSSNLVSVHRINFRVHSLWILEIYVSTITITVGVIVPSLLHIGTWWIFGWTCSCVWSPRLCRCA